MSVLAVQINKELKMSKFLNDSTVRKLCVFLNAETVKKMEGRSRLTVCSLTPKVFPANWTRVRFLRGPSS